MSQTPRASFRARRILVAAVAIGLSGVYGEQALAVELPPAPETAVVPAVDAVQVPTPAEALAVVEQAVVEQAVVEQAAQVVAEAAPAAPLPAVRPVVSVPVPAVEPTTVPAAAEQTAKSVKQPVRRAPRPARAARKTAPVKAATPTVFASRSAPERIEAPAFLPEAAGAATATRPPRNALDGAADSSLIEGIPGGVPGLPSAAALSTPFGTPPDGDARLVPVSTILRQTLLASPLERPG